MKTTPLSLHIPEPKTRPGDLVDFSDIKIPAAGIVPRPASDIPAAEMRELAYSLIRVLGDDHQAVGDWNPNLSADVLRTGLRHMVLTREFDERMVKL
ncbi:MAG: 3-methyl-2-oxobutanoate dehydrogenase (2-methylpropanoyl-transferring) subunit alpha, partial [Pseudomonadota bacterium]